MSKNLPWFRFHVRTLESPKVQMLPDATFKTWVNLLCLARMGDGVLPPARDIAFKLRVSEKDASKQISALVEAGLLDRTDHGLMPHDWDEYLPTSGSRLPWDQWTTIRDSVFERDGFACVYCGANDGILECDHVFPVSLGGSNDIGNLATACRPCNRSKSSKTISEWRAA